MTHRPVLLRLMPPRLRGTVWSRLYRPTAKRYYGLFDKACLSYQPGVRMKLIPGDIISDSIAFTGIYELQLTRMICQLAKKGGRMVDVGANLGYFSLLWAGARPENDVIAFEPSPRNISLLRENVRMNGLENRIDVRSAAVGKSNGEMQFDVGPPEQTGWGGLSLTESQRSRPVPVVRLDSSLENVATIDVLKIDIEGADTWAIQGAEHLLRERRIKTIFWEQNFSRMTELGIAVDEAARVIKSHGYRLATRSGSRQLDCIQWCASAPETR